MTAGRISTVLEMIKFEHSVFALPFALTGALLAARATGPGRAQRGALATGALSVSSAWIFTLAAVAAFMIAAWQLNPLALKLAPLALTVLFFYSFTKRFTNWSHLFLGFALGISPA